MATGGSGVVEFGFGGYARGEAALCGLHDAARGGDSTGAETLGGGREMESHPPWVVFGRSWISRGNAGSDRVRSGGGHGDGFWRKRISGA